MPVARPLVKRAGVAVASAPASERASERSTRDGIGLGRRRLLSWGPMPGTNTYDHRAIEPRWQAHWEERGLFRATNPGEPGFDPRRPKYYVLDMFPYPSGAGLHVGHPIGYIGSDIVAR